MTFAHPLWLWALALVPLLTALFFWNEKRRTVLLRRLVAARLAGRLAGSASRVKRVVRFSLLLLGLASLVVAMAQPHWGYTWQESQRKGRDVIIAIDTSRSMLAPDLAPDRLTRAKLAAQDLIAQLEGDRVGLVAFAGGAFLQAPLTIDYSAVLSSVQELDTEIIPRGGTNIAQAIQIAADAFAKGESANQALIIFTDGDELEADAVQAAARHAETLRIFTVGVGSSEGSVIPVRGERGGTEFVRDASGEVVKSKLDEARLVEIAQAAGGFFIRLQKGPADMRRIVSDGLGGMETRDIDARTTRTPIERYQWPLGLGLLALAVAMLMGERKRAAALVMLLFVPGIARASADGVKLYEKEDYKGARAEFERHLERQPEKPALHFDLGAAAYKLGDYDAALKAFGQALRTSDSDLRAKAEYNLGNTLFQRGAKAKEKEPKLKEWTGALEHYEQALNVDPDNADAKYNRDLVRKLIDELNQEQKQDDEQKDDQQKKDDEQKKDDQQKNDDQQKKDDQEKKGDQQEKDDQNKQPGDKEKQDGDGKNGDQKSENDKPKDDEKPEEGEKNGEEKQDEGGKSDRSDQNQGEPQKDAGQGEQPLEQPDRDLSGDIKSPGEPSPEEAEKAAEAEAAQAAERGEMTEGQARALMESLKGEDERVPLHERRAPAAVARDW